MDNSSHDFTLIVSDPVIVSTADILYEQHRSKKMGLKQCQKVLFTFMVSTCFPIVLLYFSHPVVVQVFSVLSQFRLVRFMYICINECIKPKTAMTRISPYAICPVRNESLHVYYQGTLMQQS